MDQIINQSNNSFAASGTGGPCGSHFGFKQFQLEDYARGALHDGLILGHDTGGGKSLALFVWPALKVGFVQPDGPSGTDFLPGEPQGLKPLAPVLLVVPGTCITRPSMRMPPCSRPRSPSLIPR